KKLIKEFKNLLLILYRVIVYKAPARNAGKALIAGGGAAAWQNIPDLAAVAAHAVVKSLEHVIQANPGNKFIAYNNIPPDVPKVKTKSNSKGVLMMNPNVEDEASWIVHTVPGFPKALRGYVFPPEEIQKGHLFICLTIKESEIDAIGGGAAAWQNTPDLTADAAHAAVKSPEHVIQANPANKFIAYNNIPPDVPKVKTKSNSKGVLMMNPNVKDEASWIVHTVSGFLKALRGYVFPPEEIQKGHLFICLTIKESEIDAIGPAPVAWQNIPDLTQANNHAVYKPLEHVIAADNGNKFIAYNNIPPDIPKVKTKSNSKGDPDEASWIVHTIPGFPKALTGYVFPPAEIQKGHLFICLTIKESEIDAI
ncbi:Deoxyribonuclease-2-alpha, partial [Trichinella patagoniensis]